MGLPPSVVRPGSGACCNAARLAFTARSTSGSNTASVSPGLDGLPRLHGYCHDQQTRGHCKRVPPAKLTVAVVRTLLSLLPEDGLCTVTLAWLPLAVPRASSQQQQCKKADNPPSRWRWRVHPGKQFDRSSILSRLRPRSPVPDTFDPKAGQYGGQKCTQAGRHGDTRSRVVSGVQMGVTAAKASLCFLKV